MDAPSQVEVLGMCIDIGVPVQSSFLPTPRGLTVLYGLNGAGKTQLLRALHGGLTGEWMSMADCELLVRLRLDDSFDKLPSWMSYYATQWADSSERVWTPSGTTPEIALQPAELLARAVSLQVIDSNVLQTAHEDERSDFDGEAFSREVAGQGLFLVEPQPYGQVVRIAAEVSPDAPQIARAISAVLSRRGEADDPNFENSDTPLWDPFYGNRQLFASIFDATSDKPPVASLYYTEGLVEAAQFAEVIAEDDDSDELGVKGLIASISETQLGNAKKKSGLAKREVAFLEAVQSVAQLLLDAVLLDSPRLELFVGTPRDWLLDNGPQWVARSARQTTGRARPLTQLSQAERRWSSLAIRLAGEAVRRQLGYASWRTHLPLFVLIDEPEAHLHRSAEAHMAHGLEAWAEVLRAHIVVASHSPELLDLASASLLQVGHDEAVGHSTVRPLSAPTRDTMALLGMTPSDLLRRQRVFLLVEGTHDQVVLSSLIGDELDRARVQVLPLRGGSQLPATIDSQFLFDFTDAHVVVMLDAVDAERVGGAWESAKATAKTHGAEIAGERLRSALPEKTPEMRWMQQFLSKALERGLEDRLTPFGLTASDVVEYLPVTSLVANSESWPRLRTQHAESGSKKDFKSWLTITKHASFTSDALRSAAASMDSIPAEVTRLLEVCIAAAGETRPSLADTVPPLLD